MTSTPSLAYSLLGIYNLECHYLEVNLANNVNPPHNFTPSAGCDFPILLNTNTHSLLKIDTAEKCGRSQLSTFSLVYNTHLYLIYIFTKVVGNMYLITLNLYFYVCQLCHCIYTTYKFYFSRCGKMYVNPCLYCTESCVYSEHYITTMFRFSVLLLFVVLVFFSNSTFDFRDNSQSLLRSQT